MEFKRFKRKPKEGEPKRRKQKKHALTKNKYLIEAEALELEAILKRSYRAHPRETLPIMLALYTGARHGEITRMKKSDLNPHERSVFIRALKGSNDRELPLRPGFFRKLAKLAQNTPGDLLFDMGPPDLTWAWKQFRPVEKDFHSLRHTFAVRLYRRTKDLRLVQVALGHRNIENTMIYAAYCYSQEELKKLIL